MKRPQCTKSISSVRVLEHGVEEPIKGPRAPRGTRTGVTILAASITLPCDRNRRFPLAMPDDFCHRILRGNADQHVHMLLHPMTFQHLAATLTGQCMKD